MLADIVTLPTKPPEGVMVIAEVFPTDAPQCMLTAVPAMAKEGTGAVTVTELDPVALP